MAKTEERDTWQNIVQDIMDAKPPRGVERYTYQIIEDVTGIKTFTVCRLLKGTQERIYYDEGVILMAMHKRVCKKK